MLLMQSGILNKNQIEQFRLLYNCFGKTEAEKKYLLLKLFTKLLLNKVPILKQYHDLLLFLKAYPDNKKMLQLVNEELQRIVKEINNINNTNNNNLQQQLWGSGIAGTSLIGQYSYLVTKWMQNKFHKNVSFDSCTGEPVTGAAILHQLYPRIEYYFTTQQQYSLQKRMKFLNGNNLYQLQNLLELFDKNFKDEKVAEILFDQLKIFTEWKLNDPVFNRTFIKGLPHPIFYHNGLDKKTTFANFISSTYPKPTALSVKEKNHLLDVAKASLAFYYRETEPITLAAANEVKFFKFSRGISIALFGMKPSRILSMESYIGYLVFKNSVPVAYGGGWMFGDRCKIGLNIYPPFRKGESALIFAEVLRLYHHFYKQQRFVVMPYQFGKGNKEGLQSAAFWFYYKTGFRPADEKIASIAAEEFKYNKKSSEKLLKLFTKSKMELKINPVLSSDLDPEQLSKLITQMITNKFNGNRQKAIHSCASVLKQVLPIYEQNRNSKTHQAHFEQFSLLFALIPGIENRSKLEKKQLAEIIFAKGGDEKKYIEKTIRHKCLTQALLSLLK